MLLTALFGVSGAGRILVPVNFRLVAEEASYIVEHSGARLLLIDPELDDALSSVKCERRYVIGAESDDELMRFGVEPAPGGRRGCHGDDQLHVGHDRPTEGRATDPPQRLAQRHDVRLAHGGHRPRRLPAHAAPVPSQRLGDALRRHGHGRSAHRAAQGRRRDPAPRRAPRRDADVRRPAVVNMVLDAASQWEGEIPGRGQVRIVVAGRRRRRPAPSSAPRRSWGGSSTRSTASPRHRRC